MKTGLSPALLASLMTIFGFSAGRVLAGQFTADMRETRHGAKLLARVPITVKAP